MSSEPYLHGVDDIDVAFARLERVPPPPGLHSGVMVAIAARARQRRRLGYVLIGCALCAQVCPWDAITMYDFNQAFEVEEEVTLKPYSAAEAEQPVAS